MFTCDDVKKHLMKRIPPRSVANDSTVSRIFFVSYNCCYNYTVLLISFVVHLLSLVI